MYVGSIPAPASNFPAPDRQLVRGVAASRRRFLRMLVRPVSRFRRAIEGLGAAARPRACPRGAKRACHMASAYCEAVPKRRRQAMADMHKQPLTQRRCCAHHTSNGVRQFPALIGGLQIRMLAAKETPRKNHAIDAKCDENHVSGNRAS